MRAAAFMYLILLNTTILQRQLSAGPNDTACCCAAKSMGDDGWDIAVEPSEGSRHRGLKGTPLDPQAGSPA